MRVWISKRTRYGGTRPTYDSVTGGARRSNDAGQTMSPRLKPSATA